MNSLPQSAALLTNAFAASIWQGLLLTAIGFMVCRLIPRAPANFRYVCLLILFLGALVLPWIHLESASRVDHSIFLSVSQWTATALSALWLGAAIYRAVILLLAWRQLRKVRRTAQPITLCHLNRFAAGGRSAALCSSRLVDAPVILGFRSPQLVLPAQMVSEMTATDLQQISLHECEHLRRRDDWANLALQIGIVLSPLNFALLWLHKQIRLQRELAVDDAVIVRTAAPLSYAACLTRLADQRSRRNRIHLALAAWERKSELAYRVEALLSRTSGWSRWQSSCATAVITVGLLSGAFWIAQVPRFVSVGANRNDVAVAPSEAIRGAETPTATDAVKILPVSLQEPTRRMTLSPRIVKAPAKTTHTRAARLSRSHSFIARSSFVAVTFTTRIANVAPSQPERVPLFLLRFQPTVREVPLPPEILIIQL